LDQSGVRPGRAAVGGHRRRTRRDVRRRGRRGAPVDGSDISYRRTNNILQVKKFREKILSTQIVRDSSRVGDQRRPNYMNLIFFGFKIRDWKKLKILLQITFGFFYAPLCGRTVAEGWRCQAGREVRRGGDIPAGAVGGLGHGFRSEVSGHRLMGNRSERTGSLVDDLVYFFRGKTCP